ncbi:hypothetical protein BC332_10813 [Capsicum chinense]|nr:hypothetical protein BC332_10813 [Capsicum chinense]
MDYPPSFNLDITQLDANEKDIPLGLVPSTFDEQDPKFAENRSKHRNDLITMKKLRDKAASRSKKSSSKAASEKKFDDFGRPRLPKGSVNDIEESRDEEFNKHYIPDEQELLDVNAADKEEGRDDDLEKKQYSDLKALETTKSLDVDALNKMTESQWDLPYSQILLDFPDAQVRELKATKAKVPAERERKKSRKEMDNYYRVNDLGLCYPQLDFIVVQSQSKNWFYLMSECKTCWNDEKTHTQYYPVKSAIELSTQQDYAELFVMDKNEDAIANIIHGFYISAGLPWHMVDEVYDPINCGKEFHLVLAVIVLKERLIHVYDSLSSKRKKESPIEIQKLAVMLPTYLSDNGFYEKTERTNWSTLEAYKGKLVQQTGLVIEIPFDVDYIQNIPYQTSDSLVKKANEGYTSDNDDPPRPRNSVLEKIDASAIVTLA